MKYNTEKARTSETSDNKQLYLSGVRVHLLYLYSIHTSVVYPVDPPDKWLIRW